ncbi:TetR/AcrR family transcriptional regulator [Amycolatopsis anabasis]|uniref:TetR/AcrR family transcriptional regulator n=1 Tax=Amycolatopsis anabasis TaxID=1840409 RepID=UPI00131E62BD|nr:TetR/AcrR family transcriptional regulator [Amycolatopsis anabasis]
MQAPTLAELQTPPEPLPRGPHGLSRAEIAARQRRRMLWAGWQLLAEKGFSATVADVTAKAGVSRKTFYDHFADREDCLLAAYDLCNAALMRHVIDAGLQVAAAEPIEQLRAAVHAYLAFLAASPVLARAALVEGPTVGTVAIEHCAQVRRDLAAMLRAWHEAARRARPDWPQAPDSAFTALAGAMHELAFQQVIAGATDRMLELEPAVMRASAALLTLP